MDISGLTDGFVVTIKLYPNDADNNPDWNLYYGPFQTIDRAEQAVISLSSREDVISAIIGVLCTNSRVS